MTLVVGDKVRVKPSEAGRLWQKGLRIGPVYEVKGLFYGCVDLAGVSGHVSPSRLEKVEEPEPKFKVGDRVRRIRSSSLWETGVVVAQGTKRGDIEVLPDNDYRYPRGCSPVYGLGAGTFGEEEFEKFEPVPFKLEHGDKVVNRKTGRVGRVLLGPVSKELKVYDEKPNIQAPDAPTARALEEYEEHFPGTYDLFKAKDNPWQ